MIASSYPWRAIAGAGHPCLIWRSPPRWRLSWRSGSRLRTAACGFENRRACRHHCPGPPHPEPGISQSNRPCLGPTVRPRHRPALATCRNRPCGIFRTKFAHLVADGQPGRARAPAASAGQIRPGSHREARRGRGHCRIRQPALRVLQRCWQIDRCHARGRPLCPCIPGLQRLPRLGFPSATSATAAEVLDLLLAALSRAALEVGLAESGRAAGASWVRHARRRQAPSFLGAEDHAAGRAAERASAQAEAARDPRRGAEALGRSVGQPGSLKNAPGFRWRSAVSASPS